MDMTTTRRRFLASAGAAALGTAVLGRAAGIAAADGRPPNILVLMCDQEREPQWTPRLPLPAREFLSERGVSFDRFIHSAVPCSPSRATFFTGLSAAQTGIFGNFLQGYQYTMDPRIPTLGDLMREQGYRTAYFGKWHLSFQGVTATSPEGAAGVADGGRYLAPYGFDDSFQAVNSEPYGYNDGLVNDPVWTRQAVDWLEAHRNDQRPWICVVSLLNPHDIAYYPRGFSVDTIRPDWGVSLPPSFDDPQKDKPTVHAQYHGAISLITGSLPHEDRAAWLRMLNIYCDLIVNTDDMLAAILQALGPALDDTVVVQTSDHGELGGAHGLHGKGPTQYEEQIRMPLTVAYPRRFLAGVRTPALAEAVDLVPTCLELAGLADPVGRYPWLRGRSLVPVLTAPATASVRDHVIFSCDENWSPTEQWGAGKPWRKHVRAWSDGRYKIARYFAVTGGGVGQPTVEHRDEQELEIYDLREDPLELRNLAGDPAYRSLTQDLLAGLYDAEAVRFQRLEIPAYGGDDALAALRRDPLGHPDLPGLRDLDNSPKEVTTGRPGAYVQIPVEEPRVTRYVYGGGENRSARVRQAARTRAEVEAQAAQRASMLCELAPSKAPTTPRMLRGLLSR